MKFRLSLSAEPITTQMLNGYSGVGMIRSEYLCRACGSYVTKQSCLDYIGNYIRHAVKTFPNDEVWYRTTDIVAPHLNELEGVEEVIEDKHYILGMRGLRRATIYPKALQQEMGLIASLHNEFSNLHILFPYLSDPGELHPHLTFLHQLEYSGKIGIMAEIPACLSQISEFISMGITHVTFGLNDLTTLLLGARRGSKAHAPTHPVVFNAVKCALEQCKRSGVITSIAGDLNTQLVDTYSKMGVDYFIVRHDQGICSEA